MKSMDLIAGRTAAGTAYLTQGPAGGTVLAIAHGWRDSPLAWQWVISALQARDTDERLQVVAVRRHAGDHGDAESAALLEAYAAQVVDAVNTAAPGRDRVVLVGQSMGGAVAELAAAKLGDRAAGLVLVVPSPLAGAALPPHVVETFEGLCLWHAAEVAAFRATLAVDRSEEVKVRYRIATPEESERSCRESFHAWWRGHPGGRGPSSVSAPTLLVTTDDTFFPKATLRADTATRFQDIEIAEIGGAGHDPHIEAPERLAEVLGNFIGRIGVGVPAAARQGGAHV
jgi:pimeloyl-ACP methyl ester carboxylesterase